MKRKLLIGVIVVFGIAAAFSMIVFTTIAAIAFWIFLVYIVRKRKADLFHDQVAPETAENRLKWLKISLWAAAIFFAGGLASGIAHLVVYGIQESEQLVLFFIGYAALWAFILATGGGLAVFLKGRRKRAAEIAK